MLKGQFRVLGLLLGALLGASLCQASVGGSISGRVRDASGAVVPGAAVTITNANTGVSQTVTTNNDGFYSFLALPVGTYKLVVKKQGFEAYQRSGITLNTSDQLLFDAVLNVGAVTQAVQVTTSATHVETANTQLGDVIKSQSMEALPLNGRSYTNLLGLQPGVAPATSFSPNNSSESTGQGNVSISGHREAENGFLVNGSNVDNALNNGTTAIPNLDSIAEFRVLTSNFDAEYGNYSGGLITVVTKAGTNRWHGDAFDFLRNTAFDARNFFDINRAPFQQNQFGGTFGGPIKHDKVFFFADYQGTRNIAPSTSVVPLPSAAEHGGDFSAIASTALAGHVSQPYFATVLSQELGYPVRDGEAYYSAGCASSAQCVFPGGIIPQQAFSAPATKMLPLIPSPNAGQYFVSTANSTRTQDDLGGMRLDVSSHRWGMLSAYYFINNTFTGIPFGSNNIPGFPSFTGGRSQLIALGDTKSFGATAVNELHVSFNRYVLHNGPNGGLGIPLSSFGFQAGVPGSILPTASGPAFSGAPNVQFNNFSLGPPFDSNIYEGTPSVLDNFSKVVGTHTLKFGGEYVFNNFYEPWPFLTNGNFIFNNGETGNDLANFLIGAPANFIGEAGFNVDHLRNYTGVYAQDSWRARPNFTFNYGLRYEIFQPFYEKSNQLETMVLGTTSTVYPGAPQGYVFPGDTLPGGGKIPRTISHTPLNNFAPRVGIAYSPSGGQGPLEWLTGGAGKFSIRTGFGLFYTNNEGTAMLDNTGEVPFDVFYIAPTPPFFAAPYQSRSDGSVQPNPFPFTIPPPGSTTFDWPKFLPISGAPLPPVDQKTSYSENYNFTLQRQFGHNTLLTLGYVGNQGHFLLTGVAANSGNQQLCLGLSQVADVAPGTPRCGPFGENGIYTRADGTIVDGTREPFGNNFGDNTFMSNVANSNYNSLEVSARHTSGPLTFFASYTYSKSMDNSSALGGGTLNPINQRLSKGLSFFDMTHDFVVSYNYVLPFENLAHGRARRLTSGWHLTGITRFATGFPIRMYEGDDRSLFGDPRGPGGRGVDTPNFLGGSLNLTDPRSRKPYFNTSLFTSDTLGQTGTANRAFFHGPGSNNFDLSLQKYLPLTESKSLEFRAELFNAFNHAQFLNPSGNISANFGRVTSAQAGRIMQLALKFVF